MNSEGKNRLKKIIPEDYRNFKEWGQIKVHVLSMLQAWRRGTLQKSSIFAGYLKLRIHLIKAKNPKHFAISLHFHPLKGNLLRTMLSKFSTNSKGTFNSIMHYHWQMEGWRWACFLRVLKRCSVVKGNIL